MRIKRLNKIQKEAVVAWIKSGGKGIILASPRVGKNMISFKCIYAALDKRWINKGDTIVYRAEVSNRRKIIFEEERKACIKILGKDPFKDFNIEFYTYQSKKTPECVMEIYDEVDCGGSALNHLVIKNSKARYKLGLTGTLSQSDNIFRDKLDQDLLGTLRQGKTKTNKGEITDLINKKELFDILLPVVYTYPMWRAISEGIISPFKTVLIDHSLGTKDKYLQMWKKYPTLFNELDYYTKNNVNAKNWNKPHYFRKLAAKKNVDLLYYNMRSKKLVAKELLKHLDKTIIFGVGKNLFEGVTDNIAESHNVEELIEKFRNEEIQEIASAKIIGRGVSLPELNNAIFMSYYGKSTPLLQRMARCLTYKKGKVSTLYFIVTEGTYETKWFRTMKEIYNEKGDVIHEIDLNIDKIISSKDLFRKGFKI